jgi:hypothetical protein
MSARTTRIHLLAATAITIATLALTACNSDDDTQDEGASGTPAETANEEETTGGGQNADQDNGQNADQDNGQDSGQDDDSGSGDDSGSSLNGQCDGSNTETTVSEVSRPLNHLLVTVTNTGSESCDLLDYPMLRFEEAQSVPPVFEDSKPQSVVTLAPGDSGYASVLLAAADGSGENPVTADSLEIFFGAENDNSATPPLPEGGVSFDETLTVTYWQQEMDDALTW